MVGGMILRLWNEWTTQILVLISFALQIFLFLFAGSRRRGSSVGLRILLWLAYLMVDATAVYTLGHLSINGSLREHELVVFWVPFLLVHLGSQDTITAYALEDNQLWPRHLLNLGVQSFGVSYVLYMHFAEIPTLLGSATILMFVVGLIKYGERIWALRCATLDNIESSIRKPQDLPDYYGVFPSQRVWKPKHDEELPLFGARAEDHGVEILLYRAREEERDEEEILLFAQGLLPLCKGGIINFPVALTSNPSLVYSNLKWNWNWKATFKVVEMELSLMYDILYTKAAVIHTWYGYYIRVLSPLAIVTAFILFHLSGNDRNGYNRADVAITYILLVGAFLLDIVSMLSAFGSTWRCNFLLSRRRSVLGFFILSFRRHFKAAASNRGWSGSIGQFNLLHFCTRDKTELRSRLARMIGLQDWWNKWQHSETLVISEDVKELVFEHVWHLVKKIHLPSAKDEVDFTPYKNVVEEAIVKMPHVSEWAGFRPELYDDTARRRKKLDDALNFSVELQEMILTWHVFTDVFLSYIVTPLASSSSAYPKAIKALSNYMVFLLAVRPDTIPGFEIRSLFEATRRALCHIWSHKFDLKYGERAVTLPQILLQHDNTTLADVDNADYTAKPAKPTVKDLVNSSIILSHGALYARLMLALANSGIHDKLGVISCYEDGDHVAMDKLKRLMPDLESSCRGGGLDMPRLLALILDTWVRLLVLTSVRCSKNAHARQISRGSELTTVVWLMEEHASVFFNQPRSLGRYMEEEAD
uniref:Uncharacterized protein n=1 Tax=Avena sativa TaxID=4498 RepID=A0ACD5VEY1_AVESA